MGQGDINTLVAEHGQAALDPVLAIPPAAPAPADERPFIVLDTDEHRVTDEAVCALVRVPGLYQQAGSLVRVATTASQGCIIKTLAQASIREELSRAARFVSRIESRNGTTQKPRHPPDWTVGAVAARRDWPGVPVLRGITEAPLLRPDGSVLDRPGYDAATQLYLSLSWSPLPVSSQPTQAEITTAREWLCEPIHDFPFQRPEHRAAWLAGVLTLFARAAIPGASVPLFLIDGNTRGTGKGLLFEAAALFLSQRPAPRLAPTRTDEEERKRITSLLMKGRSLVLIDNLSAPLGGPVLDAALTCPEWEDRIMGTSHIFSAPMSLVFWATGNNVQFRRGCDTARRTLHIRLDSPEENPEHRSGFRHPDLRAWIDSRRPRLVWAALTLLRGFCAAGRPARGLRPWGSFERWSELVRGCLVWAEFPDPLDAHDALVAEADQDAEAVGALLAAVEAFASETGKPVFTVADLLDALSRNAGAYCEPLRDALALAELWKPGAAPDPHAVGRLFRQYTGRVIGGRKLAKLKKGNRGIRWAIESTSSLASSPAPDRRENEGE